MSTLFLNFCGAGCFELARILAAGIVNCHEALPTSGAPRSDFLTAMDTFMGPYSMNSIITLLRTIFYAIKSLIIEFFSTMLTSMCMTDIAKFVACASRIEFFAASLAN